MIIEDITTRFQILGLDLIDIGSNLTHESFTADRDAVMARALQAGVRRQVITGADLASSHQAAALAAQHPARLWSTAGVHTHHAQTFAGRLYGGVAHCFTGGEAELEAYLALGLFIGITGWACDERRGLDLRSSVPKIPLERLLIETDAPYLLPRNMNPKPKSRRNEPSYLPHIAATVASLRGDALETIGAATTRNAIALFGLTDS